MRVVIERRSRQTGTTVQLVDRGLDDFERAEARERDGEWLRWETICIDHGSVCSHLSRAVATSFLSVPGEWCEDCMGLHAWRSRLNAYAESAAK